MKKKLVAALIAFAPAVAQAQGFVEIGFGQSSVDLGTFPGVSIDETDTTWAVSGGWMFHPSYLGAEVGYRDLGEIKLTGPGGSATLEVTGFMLGAVGRLPLTERLSIVPRFGLYLWDLEASASNGARASDDGSDFYFGIGADFQIGEKTHLGVHFARFDIGGDDVDVIEAKLGFRF
jgi:OOP family OmpA-OmpF porin